MKKLEKLIEGAGYNPNLDALRRLYDATETLHAYKVLQYPIDYAAALEQAKTIGASKTVLEFIQLGLAVKDKYNSMDKLLVPARHDLGKFKEIR